MSHKIRSLWRLLLGSLITILGFTACKTSQKAQKETPPKAQKENDVKLLYGPRPTFDDTSFTIVRERLLYGPPPVKVVQQQEQKEVQK